ncbi:MAG: hypothetical protein PUC34_06090 [Paludibacteraceae bacterium]|nr:hypothetical protein [Paludibacteraceae bacterium]MDD6748146.1 hypothetical protein [Paludibacteraceae bacterium]
MKKLFYWTLFVFVSIAFNSCSLFGEGGKSNDPNFQISDLQGLWEENHTQHYVRFTADRAEEYPYFYGREWDEGEDVTEQDLLDTWTQSGIRGNGWFQYNFETNGNLTEIHFMDNGGGEIPKVYVVSVLTDTKLEYYEKDYTSNKFYFSKVVESK